MTGFRRGALVSAAVIAIGIIVLALLATALAKGDDATILTAKMQAIMAFVVVLLTVALAWTAAHALEASRKQVAEAQAANQEFRFQREVEAMATIRVYRPASNTVPDGVHVAVRIRNVSQNPAVQVSLSLLRPPMAGRYGLAELQGMMLADDLVTSIHNFGTIGVLGAGEEHDFIEKSIPADKWNEWVVLLFTYHGLLGGTIYQSYTWHTDYERRNEPEGSESWGMSQIWVQPTTKGIEPFIIDWRR